MVLQRLLLRGRCGREATQWRVEPGPSAAAPMQQSNNAATSSPAFVFGSLLANTRQARQAALNEVSMKSPFRAGFIVLSTDAKKKTPVVPLRAPMTATVTPSTWMGRKKGWRDGSPDGNTGGNTDAGHRCRNHRCRNHRWGTTGAGETRIHGWQYLGGGGWKTEPAPPMVQPPARPETMGDNRL